MGARNSILLFFFLSSSAITIDAMIVFPSPVGKTTRVLAFVADFAMFVWYSLFSKESSLMNSCFI